ncbi:MAG: riboflavin biosynthesis protein RibF [Nannocystaceae bacterium]|nr:riboflavin biosynthesis protein RibF [Nannocystaceae bacterium]
MSGLPRSTGAPSGASLGAADDPAATSAGTRLEIRRDASALPPGTAACLGAFDGLHLGHQALLQRARAVASRVALVTFEPHPQRVLAPDRAPPLLLDAEQRERWVAALGVDLLVLLPFDAALSQMDAASFVRTQLLEGLRPQAVVVGADFRFGARRAGDVALLQSSLAAANVALHVVAPVPIPGVAAGADKISSTTIREALGRGEVERAAAMLGRPHAALGRVVHGDRRGRTIGVPTANLAVRDAMLPAPGVYAGWLSAWDAAGLPELAQPVAAVANLGTNPTFAGARALRLEAHALDLDLGERLYDRELVMWFGTRLRDEQRFDGVAALVQQLHADLAAARSWLATHAAPALPGGTP